MTDPLSITVSLVGFVTFAIDVAKTAAEFVQDAKGFPDEFKKLSLNVNEFAILVRRLAPAIEKMESRHEDPGAQAETQKLRRCREVLQLIKSLLAPSKVASSSSSTNNDYQKHSIKERITWALSKKQKAGELVNELERCKSTLSLTFVNELLLQMSEENERASQERRAAAEERSEAKQERILVQNYRNAKRREDILNWLSSMDFNARHSTIEQTHAEQTGTWLLEELQSWFNGSGQQIIICKGAGGVGKTYLMYKVIQHHLQLSSPDIGLAFIYFNYKEAQSREPKEYVASLLRQLEQRKDTLNSSVENVYDILSPRCQKADMRTLRCLLLDSVKSFTSRTYILLDALDECDEHGRQELVETLWPLFSPDHRVYLLIMTRPTVDMDFLLRRFPKKRQTFNIVAGEGPQSQDLKCYIDNKLSKKRIDDDERSFISQRIIQKAQGLFLLAGLHLKSVLACKTAKKRERVIKSLPMELNMAYEEEMMRIKTNPDGDEEIARRAFSWIFYAKRPLLMTELREAIAIDPIEDIENGGEGCRDLDPKSLTDPQQIIECCGSLISWERSNNTVGFSHYTISEFFKTKAHGNIEPELCIARTCLTYLCFDVFGQGSCDEWNKLRSRVQKYQLAPYIAEFCGSHILGSKEEKKVKDLVLSIVLSPGRRQALRELEKNNDAIRNGYPFWLDSRDFGGWTPLHFLATWGLAAIFNDLSLNSDSDLVIDLIQKWRYRDSNMVNTIARGLEDLHLNAKSADGATPLYNAAISGHKEIVGLILEKGADVNAKGGVFGNPLQAASWKGYCELADTLLEKGADVNAQGGHYGNALQAASSWGHCRVAEMLLENGANVNAQGGYYVNALYAASQYNHREMVQLLVEAGADVYAKGGYFGNALLAASRYGHREVVRLLVESARKIFMVNSVLSM